ncbi:hypothetical protein [Vibrio phage vB_pir03]|nr:hypothetical protein [Vibrio phage vB_pir03]
MQNINTAKHLFKTTGTQPFTETVEHGIKFVEALHYEIFVHPRKFKATNERTKGRNFFPTLNRNRLWVCGQIISDFKMDASTPNASSVDRAMHFMRPRSKSSLANLNNWLNHWSSDFEFFVRDKTETHTDRYEFGTGMFFYHLPATDKFNKFNSLCEDIECNTTSVFPMEDIVVHLLRADLKLYVDGTHIEYGCIRPHMLKTIEEKEWRLSVKERKEYYSYFTGIRWSSGIPCQKWFDFFKSYNSRIEIRDAKDNVIWGTPMGMLRAA